MTVGVTLVGIRDRIEDLTDVDGAYYVVCGRTGHRPVPVADKRFGDRAAACRGTVGYRYCRSSSTSSGASRGWPSTTRCSRP